VKYYQVLIFLHDRFGNERVRNYDSMWTVSNTGPLGNQYGIGTLTGLGVGRDNSVGIATRYGLDGPGIESRPALGPTQRLLQRVPSLSRGGEAAGVWL
jgi:hypothetical protein